MSIIHFAKIIFEVSHAAIELDKAHKEYVFQKKQKEWNMIEGLGHEFHWYELDPKCQKCGMDTKEAKENYCRK